MKSLSKHVDDIVNDNRVMNNVIIGFTETQISPSDSTCKITETLNFFNINFNNNEKKFLSLAYGFRNDVAVLDKFDTDGVSVLSFKKMIYQQSIHSNVSLWKTILRDARIISVNAIFTSSKFHKYYSQGIQL